MLNRVWDWKANEKGEFQWCEPKVPFVTPFIENCHSLDKEDISHHLFIVAESWFELNRACKLPSLKNICRNNRINISWDVASNDDKPCSVEDETREHRLHVVHSQFSRFDSLSQRFDKIRVVLIVSFEFIYLFFQIPFVRFNGILIKIIRRLMSMKLNFIYLICRNVWNEKWNKEWRNWLM